VSGYAGATLFVGTLVFWSLVYPSGRSDRGLIRLAWLGLVAVVVSVPTGLVSAMLGSGQAGITFLAERPAAPLIARLVICALAAAWLASYLQEPSNRPVVGAAVAVSLTLTIAAARPGKVSALAIALSEVHIIAAAGWVGGLIALAVALVPIRDPAVLHATLGSFSWLSIACVGTLAMTGTAHALIHAGGLMPLITSTYGAALLAKLTAVGGMLAAATGSHQYVRRLRRTLSPPPQIIGLFIGAELALGAVALVLTTDLVRAAR
jgi:copper transport protein